MGTAFDEALAHVRLLGDNRVLVAIPGEDAPPGIQSAFAQSAGYSLEEGIRWALGKNADGYNVYVSVNPAEYRKDAPPPLHPGGCRKPSSSPISPRLTPTPGETRTTAVEWVHVDIDPPANESHAAAREGARAHLDGLLVALEVEGNPPTAVLDSGNGHWLLWRLQEPISLETSADVEATTARLRGARALAEGDESSAEPARIMRLAGTINHAEPAKRAKWPDVRSAPARMLHVDPSISVAIDRFDALPRSRSSEVDHGDPVTVAQRAQSQKELLEWLTEREIEHHVIGDQICVECPSFAHVRGEPTSTSVYVMPSGAWGFNCHHASCGQLSGWAAFRELVPGLPPPDPKDDWSGVPVEELEYEARPAEVIEDPRMIFGSRSQVSVICRRFVELDAPTLKYTGKSVFELDDTPITIEALSARVISFLERCYVMVSETKVVPFCPSDSSVRSVVNTLRALQYEPPESPVPRPIPYPLTVEVLEMAREDETVVDGVALRGCVSLLAAPGQSGKSTLAIQLALALAAPHPEGFGVLIPGKQKPMRSRLLLMEDGHGVNWTRLACAAKSAGTELTPEILNRIELVSSTDLRSAAGAVLFERVADGAEAIAPTAAFDRLRRDLLESPVDLLVIDPLSQIIAFSDSDNVAARSVVTHLRLLAEEVGCAVLLLHHFNKNAKGKLDTGTSQVRGATSWVDGPRITLSLRQIGSTRSELTAPKANNGTSWGSVHFDRQIVEMAPGLSAMAFSPAPEQAAMERETKPGTREHTVEATRRSRATYLIHRAAILGEERMLTASTRGERSAAMTFARDAEFPDRLTSSDWQSKLEQYEKDGWIRTRQLMHPVAKRLTVVYYAARLDELRDSWRHYGFPAIDDVDEDLEE